jgi:hypothetical protein
MNTNEKKVMQSLQDLDKLADDFLDIQCDNIDSQYKYSDQSMMDALLVFNAVLGNIAIHRMQEKKTTLKSGEICAQDMGNELRNFVKKWTGIDPHTFYNDNTSKNDLGKTKKI